MFTLEKGDFHCDFRLPEGNNSGLRQGRPDVEANLVKLLFFFGMWLSYPEIPKMSPTFMEAIPISLKTTYLCEVFSLSVLRALPIQGVLSHQILWGLLRWKSTCCKTRHKMVLFFRNTHKLVLEASRNGEGVK